MKKILKVIIAITVHINSYSQSIVRGEYFFDTDPGFDSATAFIPGSGNIFNTSGLSEGYHFLYTRIKDSDSSWSITRRKMIEVFTPLENLYAVEYFFNEDNGFGNCQGSVFPVQLPDGLFTINIPLSDIPSDHDTLFVRVKGNSLDKWSHTKIAQVFVVVPLTLVDFTGIRKDKNTALLQWQTQQEINIHHFNIQRSIDGASFATISSKPALGKPYNNYAITDDISRIYQDKIFYRLEYVTDGDIKQYSKIIEISPQPADNGIVIYPNPAKEYITVYGLTQPGSYTIYSIDGNKIMTGFINHHILINISSLPTGMYVMQLVQAGQTSFKRFIVKK